MIKSINKQSISKQDYKIEYEIMYDITQATAMDKIPQ